MQYRNSRDINPRKRVYRSYVNKARTMRPFTMNEEGSDPSTVRMATETFDGENWVSFPTIFPKEGNTGSNNPQDWIVYDSPEEAYEEAKRRGEVFDFGKDKDAAIDFGLGAWKPTKFTEMKEGRIKPYRKTIFDYFR
jgi:hypothetical protein